MPRKPGRTPEADAREVAGLIRSIDRVINRGIHEDIARSGLTNVQVRTIEALFESGPMSLKDLSVALQLSHSTVSGVVDRLEAKGLLHRAIDVRDRRVTRIGVTEEVARYARTMPPRLVSPLADVLRRVSLAERSEFIDVLRRLADLVEAS